MLAVVNENPQRAKKHGNGQGIGWGDYGRSTGSICSSMSDNHLTRMGGDEYCPKGHLPGMISKSTPASMINESASLAFYLLDLTSEIFSNHTW